jgi:hypothetical protein
MEIEMDYRDSLEEDEVEMLLGDALEIEEEKFNQEVQPELRQEFKQEELLEDIPPEVQQGAHREVQREVRQDVEQGIELEAQQEIHQEVEQVVEQDTTTAVDQKEVAPPPTPAIKLLTSKPVPTIQGSTSRRSITSHPNVHQRPISNPATVRRSQHALATPTRPMGTAVAHQPKLAESTTGHPQGLNNNPDKRRASMQAGAKVHNGSKQYVPLHPVTGQPLVRKRFPQDIAKDALKYMSEVGDINRKNEDLIITRACEKAKLGIRRDGMPGEIYWLERDIRDKHEEIRDAHFRKYVDTPPRLLCLLVIPALSCPIFDIQSSSLL